MEDIERVRNGRDMGNHRKPFPLLFRSAAVERAHGMDRVAHDVAQCLQLAHKLDEQRQLKHSLFEVPPFPPLSPPLAHSFCRKLSLFPIYIDRVASGA
jgi:hypothetical protein